MKVAIGESYPANDDEEVEWRILQAAVVPYGARANPPLTLPSTTQGRERVRDRPWGLRSGLVDAGTPDDAGAILDAVGELGRRPADVRHILVTHCHADHAGGLAELKEATGAPAYMHQADAEMVRVGRALRPLTPTPGPLNRAVFWLFLRNGPKALSATGVEHEVSDGEVLPFAGGIRAVHAPGHCAGQLAFFWPRHGGVLFAADAVANVAGLLGLSPGHEDLEEGKRSAKKLARLDFETACFGHGRTIRRGASARFRKAFGVGQKATVG